MRMIKRVALLLITFLLVSGDLLYAQNVNLDLVFGVRTKETKASNHLFTGYIRDTKSEEFIIGATITDTKTKTGTVSDESGYFELSVNGGKNRLDVNYLGYKGLTITLEIYENAAVDIYLEQEAIQLDQVLISAQSEKENITSTISGVERLGIQELSSRSQLFGELDVLRSIQTLSGVTSVGDGASGFNVRGGNADENLILQDDGLIINPAHTLGFFSLFHPDLINSVELYKGNQPGYYGGRLSSVLQVNLREGDQQKFKGRGGIGLAASRLTLEGPIKKDKSSYIVGGRISYMDYLLNLVRDIDVKRSRTLFYDLTAKVDGRISENTKVGINAFLTADEFRFGDEVNFDYSTQLATGYISHLLSDKWNLKGILNIGRYESSLFDIQGADQSQFTTAINYIRGSIRSFYEAKESLIFQTGLEFNRFSVLPGEFSPVDENSTAVPQRLDNETGQAITPYIQLEWKPNEKLSVVGALRYTAYSRLGPGQIAIYGENEPRSATSLTGIEDISSGALATYTGIEPRLSLNYTLNEQTSIKAGYNKGFQYLNQISNTASATPIDIWKLSDTYVQPQTADNYNVGLFRNFAEDKYVTSVEAFYRDQNAIVEYKDFPDLLLNEFLEREVVNGIGRSFGIEANIKKSRGDFTYQLNYTYSRSERRVEETPLQEAINNGDWFPSNFDKPHSLNLTLSQKTGRITNLSVNFSYSTGRPLTAPISNFGVDNVLNVPIFSERNQFRIPNYHRLDVAYTIGPFGKKSTKNSIVLSVYNLYSRRNAYSVFFRQRPFQSISVLRIATLGSIFPSITYNFRFE